MNFPHSLHLPQDGFSFGLKAAIFINKNVLTSLTMIEITKITSKGQVVIPQDIREEAKIKEGEKFIVFYIGNTIYLKRINAPKNERSLADFEKTFEEAWKIAKRRKISGKDVEEQIKAVREEKRNAENNS